MINTVHFEGYFASSFKIPTAGLWVMLDEDTEEKPWFYGQYVVELSDHLAIRFLRDKPRKGDLVEVKGKLSLGGKTMYKIIAESIKIVKRGQESIIERLNSL